MFGIEQVLNKYNRDDWSLTSSSTDLLAGASCLHWTQFEPGAGRIRRIWGRPGFLSLPKEAPHTEPLSQEVQTRPQTGRETQAAPPRAPAPHPPGAPFGGTGSPRAPKRKGGPSPTAAVVASLPEVWRVAGGRGAVWSLSERLRAPGVHSAVFGWLQ